MPEPIDLATVEAARFAPLLREKFPASPWEGLPQAASVELELVRVQAYHLGGPEGQRAPFSLFFDGPTGVLLGQGNYSLTNPQVGELVLFLVPVFQREDRTSFKRC